MVSEQLYRESLAELKGFVDSQSFDNLIIAGDFNVDFHTSSWRDLLLTFMTETNLCAVDLYFHDSINYTYERDDGQVTSWPDHIFTLRHHCSLITGVTTIHSASNYSHHLPLTFSIEANLGPSYSASYLSCISSTAPTNVSVDWSRVTFDAIEKYIATVQSTLPVLSPDVYCCSEVSCSLHQDTIDSYCNELLSCLTSAASCCIPIKTRRYKTWPGWNDHVRDYNNSACLWNKIWVRSSVP